jgi:hypothetical protein
MRRSTPVLDSRAPARRDVLRLGLGALAGLLASRDLEARADAPAAKAKALVVLYMIGGPSHVDTFDPKPGAPGAGVKAIRTRQRGLEIAQHLPRLAAEAHHLAVVRGMTSKEGNHDRARYLLHTGFAPNPTVVHPSIGAWVSSELAGATDLPPFVSLGGPSAGGGFLGVQHDPFVVPVAGARPNDVDPPPGVGPARFARRLAALEAQEAHFARATSDPKLASRRAVVDKAVRLVRSPRLSAFDLDAEPEATVKAYGDTDFGRGCLAARRLVENGVRVVEVALDGWDTHEDAFARQEKLCGTLDPAFAALVHDLADRKLLDSTLVLWLGDFGRTPKLNARGGRDHWPFAWTAVLAGGGVRPGIVGATDGEGGAVVTRPVTVAELFATICGQLGIDAKKEFVTSLGRPITVTDGGVAVKELVG